MISRFGLCGPAGLPRSIVNRLHAEIVTVFKEPAAEGRLASIGLTAWPASSEEFDASIRRTTEIYRRTIKATGAKLEGH